MLKKLSELEIKKYYNNKDILKQTALQVIKDFALFGIDVEFPSDLNYAYQELYKQLEPQIHYLLDSQSTKLLSLLYQIDIPEKTIQEKAYANPDKMLPEVVSELILERELKKVLMRLYFKEKGI